MNQNNLEKGRLTLADLPSHIPDPDEIYNELIQSQGWPYCTKNPTLKAHYLQRDQTLPCIMYLAALRVSEVIPLTKDQFTQPIHDKTRGSISKRRREVSRRRREKESLTGWT